MDRYKALRKPFLDRLAENEDDLTTRLIYADWLDDFGFCEEAERHRLWSEAKKWMVNFSERCRTEIHSKCKEWAESEEEYQEMLDDGYDDAMSYEELIEIGNTTYNDAARNNEGEVAELYMYCGNRESMMDFLWEEKVNFWTNWSIITGNPLPTEFEDLASFSCAC